MGTTTGSRPEEHEHTGTSDAHGDTGSETSSPSMDETTRASNDTGDIAPESPFSCDPELSSPHLSLRRLSREQYARSIRDILTWAIGSSGEAVAHDLAGLIARMPEDTRTNPLGGSHGGFRRSDQNIHQQHIQASYDVAVAVARRLTREHLETLTGACGRDADSGNDAACLDAFIRRFGERALRRPLATSEVEFYRDVAGPIADGIEPEAIQDVIVVMLTAPQFLYLVEHGAAELDAPPGRYALTAWELAQRLSYQFWQAPPDDALRESARSGALLTEAGYTAAVERIFEDPRTSEGLSELFREWLWLDELPPMDARVGTPLFDAFTGDFEVLPETTQNMVNEVLAMMDHYTFATEGTLDDILLSDRSFATTADLAGIYGVSVWSGGAPPPFPDSSRVGLIARAALLASGSPNTRPIMKGVFIRKALLCDPIPPPPDNANASALEVSEHATTREVVEALTERPGSDCAGCHATFINPLGFATEAFDALGRARSAQVLFDAEGNVTAIRDVDTTSVPRISLQDTSRSTGAADLSAMLADSGRVHACFARHYVQWTFGRTEDTERDGCMLRSLNAALMDGQPLADALRQIALSDAFKTRTIED